MEEATSSWITACLRTAGEFRDAMTEAMFLNTYGSPLLHALVGLGPNKAASHRIERDLVREAATARLRSNLEHRFDVGDRTEAALRALIYIRLPEGRIDERGFSVIKLIRDARPADQRISMARLKEIVRDQYLLVCLDEERAIAALPKLLGADATERKAALEALHRVLAASGDLSEEGKRRLDRIEALFDVRAATPSTAEAAHA
jgi:hypothetical protein